VRSTRKTPKNDTKNKKNGRQLNSYACAAMMAGDPRKIKEGRQKKMKENEGR
jgi:hypothetical protein